jgi:FkbM family methyltransferase
LNELFHTDLARMTRSEAESAIRERVQTIYLGDKLVLARILGGPKILLSTEDLGFACHVMLDGYWEIWLTLFFARTVRAGMTVIDVGANFGYYTVLFGHAVGTAGHVVAIEPVPATAAVLRRTIDLNGLTGTTRLVIAAAGDRDDIEVHVVVPPAEPKNAAVVAPQAGSIAVPSVTIDRLTRDLSRLDLVKIDAEGGEVAIVAGMNETIARFSPRILLEFNAARCADPLGFLSGIQKHYRRVSALNFEADLKPVTLSTLVETRYGQDWLLYFEP